MGWERKRGKLHELNRLLRGSGRHELRPSTAAPPARRRPIRRDAGRRHPAAARRGHPADRQDGPSSQSSAVRSAVQARHRRLRHPPAPRDAVAAGRPGGSLYQRVFSGPGGMDPYAAAVSDVYQDLFGEGSYTGKGIYDVDAFEAAMAGRVPDNTLLSHDLFEGVFARAGLASDVEVVEEFPSRYDVAARRQHRWTRGDWQLLPWIWHRAHAADLPRSAAGRCSTICGVRCWRLRRSHASSWLAAAVAGDFAATLLVLAAIAIPAFLPSLFGLCRRRPDVRLRSHARSLADEALRAPSGLSDTRAPAGPGRADGDAIVRTLSRVLLASPSPRVDNGRSGQRGPRLTGLDFPGPWPRERSCCPAGYGRAIVAPASWPVVLPFALLWLAAPAASTGQAAPRASTSRNRRLRRDGTARHCASDLALLRDVRDTRRQHAASRQLPGNPEPVIAHRTSPTNIGLYLLSTVAAHDFGWTGTLDTVERLEATFGR